MVFYFLGGSTPRKRDTPPWRSGIPHHEKWSSYEKPCSLNTKPVRVFSGKHIPGFNPLLVKFYSNQRPNKCHMFHVTPPRVFCWFLISPCLCRRHAPPYSAYGFYGGHGIWCLWGQGCGVPLVTQASLNLNRVICVTVTGGHTQNVYLYCIRGFWKIGSCMNVYICFICIFLSKRLDIVLKRYLYQ